MDNRRILNDRRITRDEVLSSLVNLRQLTFEVTDACNLQCKYCGYGDLYFGYDKRETKFLAFEQGRILLDYLVSFGAHVQHILPHRELISVFMAENR